jgi:hypothetical protein
MLLASQAKEPYGHLNEGRDTSDASLGMQRQGAAVSPRMACGSNQFPGLVPLLRESCREGRRSRNPPRRCRRDSRLQRGRNLRPLGRGGCQGPLCWRVSFCIQQSLGHSKGASREWSEESEICWQGRACQPSHRMAQQSGNGLVGRTSMCHLAAGSHEFGACLQELL